MELLERAVAVAELTDELAATERCGRVVLVTGEAGIGKSTLVSRFRQLRSAEAQFLVGACDPLLTPRALGPLHDMARELGDPLPALLASGRREDVFAAVLEQLARSPGRRVVVIEDVHWADEATLDLLVFLGRRLTLIPVLLVVTYREDELEVDHPLRAVVGRLPTDAVRRLRLEPLSEAAVAELARRAGRPATGLRELTGGNPLLVNEVLAAADTGVPLTVRDLVLARVAGLPAPARELVRLVSVVPTPVEPWLLEAAEESAAATVDAGVAAGLLVVGAGGIGFRHELLRRAVEGSLPVLVRRELNRRVLAGLVGGGADLARLVHHAREAGEIEAVLRYGPEAARQAAGVAAHREAVGHYRAVLEHAGRLDDRTRADLLDSCSVEAYLAGLAGEAVAARRAAVALREDAGDGERLGAGLRWLSRLHWWDGNRREAEAAAARAVTVLEPLAPGHELAMAYSNQAQLDMLAGRREAALHRAGRALELGRRLDDRETVTHALTTIGSARLPTDDAGGRAELDEAFRVAVAAGLPDHAARAIGNLATIGSEVRHHGHVRDDLDRALAYVREQELTGWVQHVLGHRARLRLDEGDWAGAERDAQEALSVEVTGGGRVVDALVPLGLLLARRGADDAEATLQEATERAFATSELQWTAPVAAARAEHAWLHADDARVVEEAGRVFDQALAEEHPWFGGELAFWSRMAGVRVRPPAVLAEPHRLFLAGDWRAAAATWEEIGWPYHRALALSHSDEDDPQLEALALFDALGARQAAGRLRRELRRRGTARIPRGPIRATAAHPAGLTGRQVEVLGLLARGLTDAEIAARLSLSVKTVGHHVSALLSKLDVPSRRQASAAARRLGLLPSENGEPGGERWGAVPDPPTRPAA